MDAVQYKINQNQDELFNKINEEFETMEAIYGEDGIIIQTPEIKVN